MRKIISLFVVEFCLLFTLFITGCQNENLTNQEESDYESIEDEIGTGVKICLFGADSTKDWNIWAWKKGTTDVDYSSKSWPGNLSLSKINKQYGYMYSYLNVDKTLPMGILFVASTGSPQTSDIVIPVEDLETDVLYFIYGSSTYYKTLDEVPMGFTNGEVIDVNDDVLTISVSTLGIKSIEMNDITITDVHGGNCTINNVSFFENKAEITVNVPVENLPLNMSYGKSKVSVSLSAELIDTYATVDSTDISKFGYVEGVFTTWAPMASSAKVLLFENASKAYEGSEFTEVILTKQPNGIWKSDNVSDVVGENKYYKYRFVNVGTTYDVCDIWGKVACRDSVATQIVDIDDSALKPEGWEEKYTNPFGNSGSEEKKYTDAVIYEMHIRDWSRAYIKQSTGTFEDITTALTVGNDSYENFAEHLNDLGVTHVQILPMFEYAQADSGDTAYNWGYNPYNWNTPESRYVSSMVKTNSADKAGGTDIDGSQAVLSMRKMIKAFHDAGIAVNMDVVYNHTNGTGVNSIYDMTVPKYFYQIGASGEYLNGSGCGNATDSSHKMVKAFIIDSLKHWMKNYHINGFRFDLMGLHTTDTMKEIYKELSAIDKNVMVYGEPWTGDGSTLTNGAIKQSIDDCADSTYSNNGVACFNDTFRNAIKGSEYPSWVGGHVSGKYATASIITGLLGSVSEKTGFTSRIGRSINYVECHDNNTLIDKLALLTLGKSKAQAYDFYIHIASANDKTLLTRVCSEDTLAASFVLLAQGTPFINGGQEFLRTKNGDENSYKSSDSINQISLNLKERYNTVYNIYKGLINLRKNNRDSFGDNTNATAILYETTVHCNNDNTEKSTITDGVIKYATGDYLIYFNATDSVVNIDTEDCTKLIDISSGTPIEIPTLPSTVEAKSFVILKK